MRHPANRMNMLGRALALVFTWALAIAVANTGLAQKIAVGFESEETNENGIPKPWKLLGNPTADAPDFHVEENEKHGRILRLHAEGNESDGIYRPVKVDAGKTPFINFSWKVNVHPDGQIATDKDDAAVQVQLDFGRQGLRRRVLSYIFDPKAETGRCYDDSSLVAENKVLVLNSGREKLGEWVSHARRFARDYRKCYGTDPPRVKNVSIFCDSNDSHSESLGYCTRITFSREPLTGKND